MLKIRFVTRSTRASHYEVVRQIWVSGYCVSEQVVMATDDFQACRSIANLLEESDKTDQLDPSLNLGPTHASEDKG